VGDARKSAFSAGIDSREGQGLMSAPALFLRGNRDRHQEL